MTGATAPSSTAVRRRPPVPVVVAAVIIAVLAAFGAFGLVYFGLFVGPEVNPDAGSPAAAAFTAVGLLVVITELASLPGLLRGRRTAWHILTCVFAAQIYFSCYKLFAEYEAASGVFLVVDIAVMALLLVPATRRHVSA